MLQVEWYMLFIRALHGFQYCNLILDFFCLPHLLTLSGCTADASSNTEHNHQNNSTHLLPLLAEIVHLNHSVPACSFF